MASKKLLTALLLLYTNMLIAQTDSTALPANSTAVPQADSTAPASDSSKFDNFNVKAEKLFKILPVPLYSYSTEAGNTFGLAKFNLIHLSKKDTISKPSKLSEVVTFSTEGRINASVSTELIFKENKYIVIGYLNYKKQPEYILGIGNDVKKEDAEKVEYDRIKFFTTFTRRIIKDQNFYVGIPIDIANYFNIRPDSNSFLINENVTGVKGGFTIGTGLAANYEARDNRYNPSKGAYAMAIYVFHPSWLGSAYEFSHFEVDLRKYFNPWYKHVIALQATTTATGGTVPFYELAQLGGDKQMRGYYQGAIRDKILVDGQVEYRMPVWNIFGITGWVGTGRVANKYKNMSWDGWWLSYGGGIRIRVDSKNNTNLRLDFGFGPNGVSGTYINFAEAF